MSTQATPERCTLAPGKERMKKPSSDLTIPHSQTSCKSQGHWKTLSSAKHNFLFLRKGRGKIVERAFGHWRFQVSVNANESDTCGMNFSGSKKRCCEFLLLDQKEVAGLGGTSEAERREKSHVNIGSARGSW